MAARKLRPRDFGTGSKFTRAEVLFEAAGPKVDFFCVPRTLAVQLGRGLLVPNFHMLGRVEHSNN